MATELLLVKLGGSLITDKRRPGVARDEVIRRLASEVAAVAAARPGGVLVGHGSGSFGHPAAERFQLGGGVTSTGQLPGVSRTQQAAARLHRRVVEALAEAGAAPFSLAPSSGMVAEGGVPAEVALEPLVGALGLGLLPVVYGDVVIDRRLGASICSTERVFESLAPRLAERGLRVGRVLWLGETDGLLDGRGERIARVAPGEGERALEHAGDAGGIDVTGGMRLRMETALRLAALGVTSQILDGRRQGLLERAARGEEDSGTLVEALP
ncbi:MAG: isopentenyl phosphate kinase [Thermoanaerobaculia bacterium]|nr:isopentenyl phosphate kinase [Thermoanaerobaculia bacterium]